MRGCNGTGPASEAGFFNVRGQPTKNPDIESIIWLETVSKVMSWRVAETSARPAEFMIVWVSKIQKN